MDRKSQAALEFIMTYGWAILVVLVAIGALAYFGVLSPDRFLPSKCLQQQGIACLDHKATSTALTVVSQNALGYDVSVTGSKAAQCTSVTSPTLPYVLANGGQITLVLACTNSGTKYNGQFNITYTTPTDVGGISHTNVGQVTTKVE